LQSSSKMQPQRVSVFDSSMTLFRGVVDSASVISITLGFIA
jgi:hypothetical protein